MSFEPYLHFRGTCREAMIAYQAIFGGELQLMGYSDWPEATEAMKDSDLVMHSALTVGGRMLLASDFPPGTPGAAQAAVTVSHVAASESEARRLFGLLAEGGEVVMAFGPSFWTDGFGMVNDRFGTHWMLSAPWRRA